MPLGEKNSIRLDKSILQNNEALIACITVASCSVTLALQQEQQHCNPNTPR